MTQSLGLALYRTHAVPSIGELLADIKDIPATHQAFAALLDDYEREHFAYSPGGGVPLPDPGRLTSALTIVGLRARTVIERRLPPRRKPVHVRELRNFAIHPGGYEVDQLGTFPISARASAPAAKRS